ncbi:MAG: ankyrin repeat domain-containing protein [Acidobacteriota bacterium]|nr:ankyrin repeat domain-containing protein [Acidobacteriota bacterium]
MSEKHWKLGVILVIPLLLILWWGWEDTEPVKVSEPPQQPVTGQSESSAFSIPPKRRHIPLPVEECAVCPDLPELESLKRDGEDEDIAEQMKNVLYSVAGEIRGCYGLLYKAALEGNPNPDTSQLGGCKGQTPLHMANKPDQVRGLLDAGADVSAADEYGRTPLHRQSIAPRPSAENLEIVKMLLEAGADLQAKTEDGLPPWKHVLVHSTVATSHLGTYNDIARAANDSGVSVDDYLTAHPRLRSGLTVSWSNTSWMPRSARHCWRRLWDRNSSPTS